MITDNAKLATKEHFSMIVYTYTIKPCSKDNIRDVQNNVNFLLEKYLDVTTQYNLVRLKSVMEEDSKKVPHIHATFLGPKNLFIRPIKGWSHRLYKEYNSGFINYMNKDIRKDQYDQQKYYSSGYHFIDNHHTPPYILSFS